MRLALANPGAALALGVCISIAGGCGPDPEPRERARADPIDALRAIGYGGWDEDIDTSRKGVTIHDPARATDGVNLFTDEENTVHALDMSGAPLHRWHLPERTQCAHVEPLPGGRIAVLSIDEGVSVLEPDGSVVWQAELMVHHDIAPLASGELLVPFQAYHEYNGRSVCFDRIARIGPGTNETIWSSFEHLAELQALLPPHTLDEPGTARGEAQAPDGALYDYFHLNSIEVLRGSALGEKDTRFRAGNLLVSFRHVNLIAVLDQGSGAVLWHWGPGELEFQHMPTLTPEGRFLVFDNGYRRKWSRLLELDPLTKEIVWEWRADPPESFYTEGRGSAQRLASGNTLVCESERGRAFELTPEGEIVWEFWNDPEEGKRRRIYRMTRVTLEEARAFLR